MQHVCFSVAQQHNFFLPRGNECNYQQSNHIYHVAVLCWTYSTFWEVLFMIKAKVHLRFLLWRHNSCIWFSETLLDVSGLAPPRSSSTDLLALSCWVQVQLPIRADALGQQSLRISQPLAEVIHVTVELPPLLHGTVESPAPRQESGEEWIKNKQNKFQCPQVLFICYTALGMQSSLPIAHMKSEVCAYFSQIYTM